MVLASPATEEAARAAAEIFRLGIHTGVPIGQILWLAAIAFAVVWVFTKITE